MYLEPGVPVTSEDLATKVEEVCSLPKFRELDIKKVQELVEMDVFITYSGAGVLDAKRDNHEEWLFETGGTVKKEREIDWRFWKHYEMYLRKNNFPEKAIENTDLWTNRILMRLEDPKRKGGWSRKGMVVGEVQSGKTANYTGLICKAADAGYKIIIVLAGLHKSLRAQTQHRVDEAFIGFNTDKDDNKYRESSRIGVGTFPNHPIVNYLTTSNDNGDFSNAIAQGAGIQLGGNQHPVVLVIKKNKSIINNLILWCRRMGLRRGNNTIENVPLLLIDDECDNASVNTNKLNLHGEDTPRDEDGNPIDEFDPTAINQGIRTLLKLFNQSAYVGYTATPFANILIHRESAHQDFGEDLFPKNFIISLPKPSNYVGPSKFFGLDGDDIAGLERVESLPLYNAVRDAGNFIPNKHKSDFRLQQGLPNSLVKAIRCFVLSSAIRYARGMENQHNSMLIHVTRFTLVQGQVGDLVQDFVDKMVRRLKFGGSGAGSEWHILQKLYEDEYEDITSQVYGDQEILPWGEVKNNIPRVLEKLQKVKRINGSAGDILEYKKYKDVGINVIAIGGDKLSRGLTLEGLTVSYYLRASRTYDTLLQMGRWFGYRPNYLDVCRLFTTPDLYRNYRHIAMASAELKQEFDYMVKHDQEPSQYGLKVRSHPETLTVTAINKMRSASKMKVTYDGHMVQTLVCSNKKTHLVQNHKLFTDLVKQYQWEEFGKSKRVGFKTTKVSGDTIIKFISNFNVPGAVMNFNAKSICNYIALQNKHHELTEWTIGILSPEDKEVFAQIDEKDFCYTRRSSEVEIEKDKIRFGKAILSPTHEKIDLTTEERLRLAETGGTPKEIRQVRSAKRGLLLIYILKGEDEQGHSYGTEEDPVLGLVMSFPKGRETREVEYVIDALIAENI